MAGPNLDKMPLKDLRDLEVRVAAAILRAQEREKAELKQRFEELASEAGMTVQEIYGSGRGRGAGKGGKVAVKYMNPDNKSETWTGRGRQPRWLTAKLGKGAKLVDFSL
jgi:DNA-binding protein H-NS